MKKVLSISLALFVMALALTGCNCYTKMMKKTAPGITASCSPEVLTLKGDNVVGTITVNFPAEVFHSWGVIKVTPVLKYQGGEIAAEPKFLQGDKVKDNYTVISSKTGGSYQQNLSFVYKPEMRISQLVLRVEAKCIKQGSKIKNYTEYNAEIPVAYGVSTLQSMADNFARLSFAPDSYVRTTHENQSANIMFEVNKADVRKDQLNSNDIATLQKFINESSKDAKKSVGNIYTQSYASPEGPLDLNTKLSTNRGTSTQKSVADKFAKEKTAVNTFDINAMGEDWEGFQELVAKSNIQDKELILQVLSQYKDPQVRDREIKNLSAAFIVLKEKILPELRRSKMTVNVEVQGLTDNELKAAVASDVNKLKVEEMLFAATLYNDNATKAKIYKAAADKYNDFRAWNNYGVAKANQGDYTAAISAFQKASSLNNSNPQVINNMGVVALANGKKDEAARFFAASTDQNAKYNKGLVELANGNYAAAATSLDGYNKAVAQLLNGEVTAAKKEVMAINDNWSADYIRAVIAAKEGDTQAMTTSLKAAIAKNPEVKDMAATEVNFLKYAKELSSIVNIKSL